MKLKFDIISWNRVDEEEFTGQTIKTEDLNFD